MRLLFNYFLLLYIPPGGMGRVNRKATLSLKTWCRSPKTVAKRKFHLLAVNHVGKNVVSIAQNCSETQISVSPRSTLSVKTWRRSPKTVAKREFHLLAVNPLGKNVVSIAQNCSKTSHFCVREAGRFTVDRLIHFCARRCGETHIVTFGKARAL